jgi:hypothetical protein
MVLMPHVSEMNPQQREAYDRWLASGRPNPHLLAIRRTKQVVRAERSRGASGEAIRAGLLDRAGRMAGDLDAAGRERFMAMIGRAIDESLAEP